MKSYFIRAHVELADGTRICVGKPIDFTDDHIENSSGFDILFNVYSSLQDLFTQRIDYIEDFSLSLDDSDDDYL